MKLRSLMDYVIDSNARVDYTIVKLCFIFTRKPVFCFLRS